MMQITVGSTALKYFNLNRREPIDLDLWTNGEIDVEQSDSHIFPQYILDAVPTVNGESNSFIATPDAIYTIKCSHAIYDIKWDKTKGDILWLKANGCKLIEPLYSLLKDHWKKEHGNKDFLSLNQTKEDFFTDNVTYIYDHDMLHDLVAYPNPPMYTKALNSGKCFL